MTVIIGGTGTIAGLQVGGLTGGCVNTATLATSSVNTAALAASSVTQDKVATGTVGYGPAFSVYTSSQTVAFNTWTKVVLDTEYFDTANCFNTSTYRFTPNVAGYYQFNFSASFGCPVSTGQAQVLAMYKNGSVFNAVNPVVQITSALNWGSAGCVGCDLIYLNGSTDYAELYCYWYNYNNSSNKTVGGTLSGSLMRAA